MCGGWPELAAGRLPPRIGTATACPNVWERTNGFDPAIADGSADRDRDGLTNLEDYLADRAERQ